MPIVDQRLARAILEPEIRSFINDALRSIYLGFHVRIIVPELEDDGVLYKTINAVLADYSNVTIRENKKGSFSCLLIENESIKVTKILLVECNIFDNSKIDAGFITMYLPSTIDLLPSISTCIEKVLEYYDLFSYRSIYKSKHKSILKRVLAEEKLDLFVNTVVQMAFQEGVRGEDFCSDNVEQILQGKDLAILKSPPKQEHIVQVMDWILETSKDPQLQIKSLLSYYSTEVRRLPQLEASRRLDLSRSTLQSHLKSARELKLDLLFPSHADLPQSLLEPTRKESLLEAQDH